MPGGMNSWGARPLQAQDPERWASLISLKTSPHIPPLILSASPSVPLGPDPSHLKWVVAQCLVECRPSINIC